jgi:hypothetical protein
MSAPSFLSAPVVRTCSSCWRPAKRAAWIRCGYCGTVFGDAPAGTPETEPVRQVLFTATPVVSHRRRRVDRELDWSRILRNVIVVVFVAYAVWLIAGMAGA